MVFFIRVPNCTTHNNRQNRQNRLSLLGLSKTVPIWCNVCIRSESVTILPEGEVKISDQKTPSSDGREKLPCS